MGGKNSNSNSKEFFALLGYASLFEIVFGVSTCTGILVPDCLKLAINVRRMKSGNCIYDSDDSPLLY